MDKFVFLGAIFGAAVTGALRLFIFFADRRQERVRQRLGIEVTTRIQQNPSASWVICRPRPALAYARVLPHSVSDRLQNALTATGNSLTVLHMVIAGVAAGVLTGFCSSKALPIVLAIAVGAGAGLTVPGFLLRIAQARYQRRFLVLFPDALDFIVRAVKAGLPTLDAIDLCSREIAPPVSIEFRRILDEVRVGMGMEDVLRRATGRIRVQEFRFFVVCLLLQQRTGAGLGATLSSLSHVIRQRKAADLKARALSAEPKASAAILTALPIIVGAALFVIDKPLISSLYLDPRGRVMLELAIASLLTGIGTITILLRRKS